MNKYPVIIRSLICITLSSLFWGCGNQAEPPDAAEPHVHGVQIDPLTGIVYVSDEGEEECFFESVTILQP